MPPVYRVRVDWRARYQFSRTDVITARAALCRAKFPATLDLRMQSAIRQAPLLLTVRDISPENQRLAAAVLAQAVGDAQKHLAAPRWREDTTAFLLDHGTMLAFWADVGPHR